MQFIRQSKYKHVFGKLSKKEELYENLRLTKSNSESSYISINSKYLAFISEAGGGGVFTVIPLSKKGKQDPTTGIITGHTAPVTDISWCPFDDSIIASSSEDCTVKLWRIIEDEASTISYEVIATLVEHQRKVLHIKWHPLVQDVLISTSSDNTLIVWNLTTLTPIHTFELSKTVSSMSISFSGANLLVGCRESHVKIIDLIKGTILEQEDECHESSKSVHVAYVDETHFITTGFTKRSDRQLALWSTENLKEPLCKIDIDVSNGSMYPFYDFDTKIIFLLAKGDIVVRYFEYDQSNPSIHYLNRYDSNEPQTGFNFLPKIALNVNANEIMRLYKMTNKKNCEVISFIVPRKSEMFQEDIYPDTIGQMPAIGVAEWLDGKEMELVKYSMKQNYGKNVIRRETSMVNKMMNGSRISMYSKMSSEEPENQNDTILELKSEIDKTKKMVTALEERLKIIEERLLLKEEGS